ncbi:MAG: energy-coupling factor ABC transporter ATP-binding protein, partial [Gemmataceae bacterium]
MIPEGDVIVLDDLTFSYPHSPPVLRGLSLRVRRGQSIGLVGPNGAGKTSLFLCLMGVLHPGQGSVRVAGLNVLDPVERKKLPQRVGIVFQNSDDQLFCSTVEDDVAFGPLNMGSSREEARQRVLDSLKTVGMSGLEQRVPYHLSGGEKRRVALAGILAMQPELLLLDEPSMFLDPRGRRELIHLLNRLPGTKLIASHDLEFILQ